ncbi:MAG TPA: protein kinase [Vicinamibacteria bacterium]|nr:protein kinase [Vicinamibacteria bacterium]
MSQHKPAAEPTEIAGRYQVIQKLGAGAFGTVYKARDKVLGRMLAIKTIRLEGLAAAGASLDELLDRFKREAQVSAQLKHPHIVTIYDIGEAEGLSYLAMEFIDGVGLERVIASAGRLPLERAAAIGAQVAEALDFAHRHNVVHRDIKPANIMIEAGDRVKVTDFGIAKVTDSADHLTMTGSLLGTPSYMSPEQARGGAIDGRSDLFSVGCVLYEMITGKKAFRGDSITALIFKIITEEPVPLREELPNVDEAMTRIISKALAKAPEVRYQSGQELAQDLLTLTRGGAMPTVRQTEVATAVIPPGAATVSSAPTAIKAGSSTQPLHAHTQPVSAPGAAAAPTLTPAARTQVAPHVVRPTPIGAAHPAPARKSRAGLILGLLAAGLLVMLAVGAAGAYFLFLKPKPDETASRPADQGAASSSDTEPSISTPPVTQPTTPETAPPITAPEVSAPSLPPPVTTPPDSGARRAADTSTGDFPPPLPPPARDIVPEGPDLSPLDRAPREGRDVSSRVGAPYGAGGYRTGRILQRRQRLPDDVSRGERPAAWVLLNLADLQAAYHARNGRYGTFTEALPGRGVAARSFQRHHYRFDLTTEADGFKVIATPLSPGLRVLVVDDSGIVDYPDE